MDMAYVNTLPRLSGRCLVPRELEFLPVGIMDDR